MLTPDSRQERQRGWSARLHGMRRVPNRRPRRDQGAQTPDASSLGAGHWCRPAFCRGASVLPHVELVLGLARHPEPDHGALECSELEAGACQGLLSRGAVDSYIVDECLPSEPIEEVVQKENQRLARSSESSTGPPTGSMVSGSLQSQRMNGMSLHRGDLSSTLPLAIFPCFLSCVR